MNYYLKENQERFYELLKTNALEDEICFNFYEYNGASKNIIEIRRKELLEKSEAVGETLKENGCEKGDRIVIFSTQTADNVLSVVGSMLTGAIFTIIPPPVDANKMDRFISVVKSCSPKFILCSKALKEALGDILLKFKDNKTLAGLIDNIKIINVDECNKTKEFIAEDISLEDVVYIQYSSGSTSAPKGVMVKYGNLLTSINSALDGYSLKRLMGWVPFFHNLGLVYLLLMPIIRKDIYSAVMSPAAFLEKPIRWIEALSEQKVDLTLAPNSVYGSYPNLVPASTLDGKNIDLSSINVLLSGSEIVDHASMQRFAEEYKNFGINISKFMTGYGLSETTCGIASGVFYSEDNNLNLNFEAYKNGKLLEAADDEKDKLQFISNGHVLEGITLKIINPSTLEECAEDEFGEIWIQAGCVAKEYYNNPEATEETFRARLKNYDGYFLRTGDLGIVKNKNLYITGRMKELIIINGNNILPNDISIKLKEEIKELEEADIIPFSAMKEKKERLIIVLGGSDRVINKINNDEILSKINSCILKYFEVTPYEVPIVRLSDIPTADNGKVSIMATAKLYNSDKLVKVNETDKDSKNEPIVYNTKVQEILGKIIKDNFTVKARIKDNLLSLGLDSLAVVGLTTKIEKKFKVSVPVAFIFSNPTIEKVSEYINRALAGEDLSVLEKDKSFLKDEVKLDKNIRPGEYKDDNPEMKNVFLTGTTGFVGAYLIQSILETSSAKIYCHVRAKSEEAGIIRIKENMQYYHLWKDEYRESIVPVLGSLEKPLLGIDEEKYKYLTEHVDTIYHNGAVLNFIYPYERLKDANVLGTIKTMALACEGRAKYYNYISSYSVFDNPSYFNKEVSEDDPLNECRGYYLSYSETKWVAENIIHIARERGLRAAIYRPGEITGADDTGIWKLGDSVSRTIKAIIDTGTYPIMDMNMHMTQVDYIAKAIVSISKKGENYGKAYNLLNSVKVPLKWLGEVINNSGIKAEPMDYEEWKQVLFNSGNEHPLKLLEALFKLPKKNPEEEISARYGEVEAKHSTRNADNALKGTGIKCDPINEELIRKYLKNFIK